MGRMISELSAAARLYIHLINTPEESSWILYHLLMTILAAFALSYLSFFHELGHYLVLKYVCREKISYVKLNSFPVLRINCFIFGLLPGNSCVKPIMTYSFAKKKNQSLLQLCASLGGVTADVIVIMLTYLLPQTLFVRMLNQLHIISTFLNLLPIPGSDGANVLYWAILVLRGEEKFMNVKVLQWQRELEELDVHTNFKDTEEYREIVDLYRKKIAAEEKRLLKGLIPFISIFFYRNY